MPLTNKVSIAKADRNKTYMNKNISRIIRAFKKQGNAVVETTKVVPTVQAQPIIKAEQPKLDIDSINPIKLRAKIAELEASNGRTKNKNNGTETGVAKHNPAPTVKQQTTGTKYASFQPAPFKYDSNGSIYIKPPTNEQDETAIVYNMVRLGYRIQYRGSNGQTLLFDNKHPVQIICKKTWDGIQPITKDDFQSIVDNRVTLAEIDRLYRLVYYTGSQMAIYYQKQEKNLF